MTKTVFINVDSDGYVDVFYSKEDANMCANKDRVKCVRVDIELDIKTTAEIV